MNDILYEIRYLLNQRECTIRWVGDNNILVALEVFKNEYGEHPYGFDSI